MKVIGTWIVLYSLIRGGGIVLGVSPGTGTIVASSISFMGAVTVALVESHYNRRDKQEDYQTKLRNENRRLKKRLAIAEGRLPRVPRK